uniref:Uncharacterized protein LOC104225073 n=1 Tax=Nicotiana sylvestris TaxID=4096 RepID=A0A1U7W931_NICSY|nr:PREDICTED: uncharacterized protein LOC104225073 [Nicotiana sylvestris]
MLIVLIDELKRECSKEMGRLQITSGSGDNPPPLAVFGSVMFCVFLVIFGGYWRRAGRARANTAEQPGRASTRALGKLDVNVSGKSVQLAKILQKRKVNITCVQETRCAGSKAREADGFKLWHSGGKMGRNGVGILVDKVLRELVVEWVWMRRLKGASGKVLDEVVCGIPPTDRIFIGGNFNGRIGRSAGGYDEVQGGFGFGVRNGGGTSLLDFTKAFDLVIVNSCLQKRETHFVTLKSAMAKTQIGYLFLCRCDKSLCTDCKVIPSENLMT